MARAAPRGRPRRRRRARPTTRVGGGGARPARAAASRRGRSPCARRSAAAGWRTAGRRPRSGRAARSSAGTPAANAASSASSYSSAAVGRRPPDPGRRQRPQGLSQWPPEYGRRSPSTGRCHRRQPRSRSTPRSPRCRATVCDGNQNEPSRAARARDVGRAPSSAQPGHTLEPLADPGQLDRRGGERGRQLHDEHARRPGRDRPSPGSRTVGEEADRRSRPGRRGARRSAIRGWYPRRLGVSCAAHEPPVGRAGRASGAPSRPRRRRRGHALGLDRLGPVPTRRRSAEPIAAARRPTAGHRPPMRREPTPTPRHPAPHRRPSPPVAAPARSRHRDARPSRPARVPRPRSRHALQARLDQLRANATASPASRSRSCSPMARSWRRHERPRRRRDADGRSPRTPRSRSRASRKTFTAALVLALVEEAGSTSTRRSRTYLPDARGSTPTITVRQLLDHTSGLRDFFFDPAIDAALLRDRGRRWDGGRRARYVGKPYFKPGHRLALLEHELPGPRDAGRARRRRAARRAAPRRVPRAARPRAHLYQPAEAPRGPVAHGYRFAGPGGSAEPIDLSDGTDDRAVHVGRDRRRRRRRSIASTRDRPRALGAGAVRRAAS